MITKCPHCGGDLNVMINQLVTYFYDEDGDLIFKEADDLDAQSHEVSWVTCPPCDKVWAMLSGLANTFGGHAEVDGEFHIIKLSERIKDLWVQTAPAT